jgi:hypothetical protein
MKTNDNNVKNFLKRAKLLMEYDLKKTSDENIKILNEQSQDEIRYATVDKERMCNDILARPGSSFLQDSSEKVNPDIGLTSMQWDKYITKGVVKLPPSWKVLTLATIKSYMDKVVDALDWSMAPGTSLRYDDLKEVMNQINYKYYYDNGSNRYYPAVEGLRYLYNQDEDGETLSSELQDYSDDGGEAGANADEAMRYFEAMYSSWIVDVLRPFYECGKDPNEDPVDPKPPIVDPKPKPEDEPWKECCVFSSSRYPGAKYRKTSNDIIIRVEYGYMLLKPGNAGWDVGGSLTVFDDDDKAFNTGKWTCGGGEFKFYVTG